MTSWTYTGPELLSGVWSIFSYKKLTRHLKVILGYLLHEFGLKHGEKVLLRGGIGAIFETAKCIGIFLRGFSSKGGHPYSGINLNAVYRRVLMYAKRQGGTKRWNLVSTELQGCLADNKQRFPRTLQYA